MGGLLLLVGVEDREDSIRQVDRTTASQRLGVGGDESAAVGRSLELSRHAEYAALAVEILPHETQCLTPTKTRRKHEGVESLGAASVESLEEVSSLCGGKGSPFGPLVVRGTRQSCDIAE